MADFMGMMKQAAQLQSKMEALQAELDQIEVEGTAGGGLVSVRMTAKGELVAAHADARRKAEGLLQEKMKSLTGGLPLPPGLKLF